MTAKQTKAVHAPKKSAPVAAPTRSLTSRIVDVKGPTMPPVAVAKTPAVTRLTDAQVDALTLDQRAALPMGALDEAQDARFNARIAAASGATAKGPKFESITTKHGTFRVGTIVHSIYEVLARPLASALTLEEAVDFLHAKHPTTTKENFRQRIQWHITQAPVNYGASVGRNREGKLSLEIEGYDATKVITPEQQKAIDAKRAAKEAKEKAKAEKAVLTEAEVAAKAKAKADKAAEKAKADEVKAKAKADKAAEKALAVAKKAADDLAAAQAKAAEAAKLVVPGGPAVVVAGKLAAPATTKGKK